MTGTAEQVLATKRIYEGKIINLRVDTVSLPGGRTATREIVEHAGAVAIVPVLHEDQILLVRQFRHAAGKSLLEIPAGKLEPGESAHACAGRELLEETGYAANNLQKLVSFFSSPGFTNEMLHLYLATGLTHRGQEPDDDEQIEVVAIPLARAVALIREGGICDAKSIAGIFAARDYLTHTTEK